MNKAPRAPASLLQAGPIARGLLCIGIVFLLREAHALMLPIAVAVVLTLVLSTPVRFMSRHGIPEFIGAGVLVVSLIGGSTLLATSLVGPASEWWERAPSSFAALVERAEQLRETIGFIAVPQPPATRRVASAPPPADPLKEKIVTESVVLTGVVIGRTFSFGLSALATVILLYFLLASEHWLLSRTVEAITRRRTRALLLGGVRSAQREIGRFIGALSIINLAVAIITTLLMMYIDLPNPVLWGSVAGFLNFIPYIGPILVVGLLLLAGAISFAATPALIAAPAAAFLLVHSIESNIASPWFIGRRLALSRISIFLSVMFWGWLWGLAGAILAVPFLIAFRSTCRRVRRLRRWCVYLDESRDPPPSLSLLLGKGAAGGHGRLLRRPHGPQPQEDLGSSKRAE